jgi:hypothetical protein
MSSNGGKDVAAMKGRAHVVEKVLGVRYEAAFPFLGIPEDEAKKAIVRSDIVSAVSAKNYRLSYRPYTRIHDGSKYRSHGKTTVNRIEKKSSFGHRMS